MNHKPTQIEIFHQQLDRLSRRCPRPPESSPEGRHRYTANGTRQCLPVSPDADRPPEPAGAGIFTPLRCLVWGMLILVCLGLLVYFFLWPFLTHQPEKCGPGCCNPAVTSLCMHHSPHLQSAS